jgi:hypothetical protein
MSGRGGTISPLKNHLSFTIKFCKIHPLTSGPIAQRLEQRTHNPLVVGSNPTGPTDVHVFAPVSRGVFVWL